MPFGLTDSNSPSEQNITTLESAEKIIRNKGKELTDVLFLAFAGNG
ncbi:MAG: hypothetical protein LBJ00_11220 [Planctomycetaceae bacterium]|nr:hypothetical protein [Planctomycetaceae bacterium]